MRFLEDLEIPVRIRDPIETLPTASPRQQARHQQVITTTTRTSTQFIVPTGVYWILKSLIIVVRRR